MEIALISEDQMGAVLATGHRLRFKAVKKPTCEGCIVHRQNRSEGLPCSPGVRKDKKHGIWELDNG